MPAGLARSNWRPMVYIGAPQLTRLLEGWADRPGAISVRLAEALRHLIRSGQLPSGARLPSERILAAALGTGRRTVGQAFDTLRGEAILISRSGAGTFVSSSAGHVSVRGEDRLRSFVHRGTARIDLRSAALPGIPLVENELDRLSAKDFAAVLHSHGYVPGGLPALRESVADYYSAMGLPTRPDEILVTSGAQQGLRLLAETILERGDTVVVEEPTFRGAIEVLRTAGARLVGVPSGPAGVDTARLEDAVRRCRPAFVLLQSTVHNPTGSILPESARANVARFSAERGLVVVDDAAPADALIDGALPPPLAAYGCDVLTIGSASKGFWGGLRVGWLRASTGLVDQLAVVKGAEDLGTSIPSQVLTSRLLNRAAEARAYRRTTLRAARSLVLDTLGRQLPQWRPLTPAGGASLWIQLPPGHSATALTERASREGVDVLPGPTFSHRDALDNWLRIGYAAPHDLLTKGLDRLAIAWNTMRAA